MVGTLEAKYKLTRNDPTFDIDLSEQNLISEGPSGGTPALFPYTTGVCTEAELPYTSIDASPLYPLQPGSQTSHRREHGGTHRRAVRCCQREGRVEDLWPDVHGHQCRRPELQDLVRRRLPTTPSSWWAGWTTPPRPAAATGSSRTVGEQASPTTTGFSTWPTPTRREFPGSVQALDRRRPTTPAPCTSAAPTTRIWPILHTGINASATWKGGLNKNVWDTSTANWQTNGTGSAFTWVNQEIGATFDNIATLAHTHQHQRHGHRP